MSTAEELIYANWLRTGGSGSISYWRSIGSPLYYTPTEPEPTVYYCPYCGGKAYSQAAIDAHVAAVHEVPGPTAEELVYQNWLRTGGSGSISYWRSIGSPLYYTPGPEPEPPPGPTDEELIYQNWLRTGGTGSIEYWRSIGSPLYYTPEVQTFHLSVLVPSWAAGGYVEPGSGDYPANTTITLRAYPLSGYQFTGWGGNASGVALTYNLYMNSDKNVEAYFEKIPVVEYKATIVSTTLKLQ